MALNKETLDNPLSLLDNHFEKLSSLNQLSVLPDTKIGRIEEAHEAIDLRESHVTVVDPKHNRTDSVKIRVKHKEDSNNLSNGERELTSSGMDNLAYSSSGDVVTSTLSDSQGVSESADPGSVKLRENDAQLEPVVNQEEDERILAVLREVVRKCTDSDPMKRPSAADVLDMLKI